MLNIVINEALGASGGLWDASRFQSGFWATPRLMKVCQFSGKMRFLALFWARLGPKKGPKIALLGTMCGKKAKKEVLKKIKK